MSDPIITTSEGPVRGRTEAGVRVFRGIPYAAPPTGAARFEAPAPHEPWRETLDATRPEATAPQPRRDGFGALDMSPYFGQGWVEGEDYLTLNVWAPVEAHQAPVMVFVHGGGFITGSTRAPMYDGTAFARDGVVLVTVNYRLGVPGFLDLPGAPANRGMLDVVAALRWVRRNIGSFGGDAGEVTVFGQSAGATLTGGLLASSEAAGLFRRVIMQSGSGLGAFSAAQAARVMRAAAETLGVEPTAAAFAAVPDERLVEIVPELAGMDLRIGDRFDPLLGLSPFSLVMDRQPAEAVAAGAGAEVAVLIGTNAEEGNLYLVPQGGMAASTEAEVYATAARVDADPEEVVARFRARLPGASPGELRSAMMGEALFGAGSRRLVEAHRSRGLAPVFVYEFAWRSPGLGGLLGAAHTVELPFVFDRLDLPELRGPRGLLGDAEPPGELAERMRAAWVAFARSGDPGWEVAALHRFRARG